MRATGKKLERMESERMEFEDCREKYFILVEGDERAAIRDTPEAAKRKRKQLSKFSNGKKIFIFKAGKRNVEC